MKYEIVIPFGNTGRLVKETKASHPTVLRALRGESNSLLSMKIRKKAIELGGIETVIDEYGVRHVVTRE